LRVKYASRAVKFNIANRRELPNGGQKALTRQGGGSVVRRQ